MKMREIALASIILIGLSSGEACAGFYKTTVHSRANCLNNESITWWNGHPYDWRVVSIHKHTPTGQMHMVDTGYVVNDRVAAIHWGEGVHAGFVVWGYHYLKGWGGGMYFASTYAEDCEIIEGW
jgi:hypothetical protein